MSLEYILAGILIFLILMVTEISVFNMTVHTLAGMEQSEEYTKAAEILDSLLLSPGDPPDWWDYEKYPSPDNITSIGLALQGSVEAYVLDVRKLSRFDSGSSGYLSPVRVRSLLGLSRYYDFSLEITPIFNITISNVTGTYTIRVRDLNGLGVPNVNITAFYVPSSIAPGVDYPCTSNMTRGDGSCTVTFDYNPEYGIAVCARQAGVKVIASKPENLKLRIEGERVFTTTYSLIPYLSYETASGGGLLHGEVVSRYVKIEGVSYYVEFNLWS